MPDDFSLAELTAEQGRRQSPMTIPGEPAKVISVRQNNPFNLKGNYWGAIGVGKDDFSIYRTPEAGVQAGISQIKLDQSRKLSFGEFAEKYAPRDKNPTWKADVAKMLGGISDDTPISRIPTMRLVNAVGKRESSVNVGGEHDYPLAELQAELARRRAPDYTPGELQAELTRRRGTQATPQPAPGAVTPEGPPGAVPDLAGAAFGGTGQPGAQAQPAPGAAAGPPGTQPAVTGATPPELLTARAKRFAAREHPNLPGGPLGPPGAGAEEGAAPAQPGVQPAVGLTPAQLATTGGAMPEFPPRDESTWNALKDAQAVSHGLTQGADAVTQVLGKLTAHRPYADYDFGAEDMTPEEVKAAEKDNTEFFRGAANKASLGLLQFPAPDNRTGQIMRTAGGYAGMLLPLTRLTTAGVGLADLAVPAGIGTAFNRILGAGLGFAGYGAAAETGETIGKGEKFDNAALDRIVNRSIDDWLVGSGLAMGSEGVAAGLSSLFALPEIKGLPGTEVRKPPTPGAPGGETYNINPQNLEDAVKTYDYLHRTGSITGKAVRSNPWLRAAAILHDQFSGKSADEIIAALREGKPFQQAEEIRQQVDTPPSEVVVPKPTTQPEVQPAQGATAIPGEGTSSPAADDGIAKREVEEEIAEGEDFFDEYPQQLPISKLEARLDELQAEYPRIDRSKASTVLRALPDAENGQVANLTKDGDLLRQLAQGGITAADQRRILNQTLPGKQTGLFEEPQGDLFSAPKPAGEGKGTKEDYQTMASEAADNQETPQAVPDTPRGTTGKMYSGGPDIEDIARLATPGLEAGGDIKSGIQSLLFPGAQGPEHLAAAEVVGHQLGSKARDTIIQATALKPFKKMFDKLGVHNPETPIEQNVGLKAMSDLSTGRPLSGNLEKYRYIRDKLYNKLLTALDKAGVALETVRENYFPGMWTKESRRAFNQAMGEAVGAGRGRVASEGEADKTVMDLNDWSKPDKVWVKTRVEELMKGGQGSDKETLSHLFRRPLKGSEAFRKAKTFDDIMTGAEFGLKPISNNPVDLDLLKMEEMGRSLMINRALREWEPKGDVVNVDNSGRPLRGRTKGGSKPEPLSRDVYEKIKDRHGDITTRDPDTHQLIKIGERWAKKPVADILNNYLASGLVNNRYFGRAYRGWMAMGNLMNQAQLGLGSMFHVGFTAGVAQIKAHANVVQDLYGLAKGNRSIADLAKTVSRVPTAMARPLYKGSRVLTEHASPTVDVPDNVPVGQLPSDKAYQLAYVNKAVEMAGGAFRMEKGLRTSQSEKMMRDWRSGVVGKGKAILRSPVALTEASMWPTMVAWVPRVKATTIADSMLRIRDMNPGKTMMELRPQFRQAWNLIDQAAGQVQYDRTFIHRAALNVFQLFTRAPGWSGGSFALFGGALKDTGTFFKEWAKTGKAPENLPPRVAFTISTIVTTMAINGLMTYMFTGEKPHGMDWWAFRDGGKDKNGTPTRMVLPTYAKELFSWFKNAPHTLVAKMHPLLSLGISFVRNRDYYNNMIWNEEKGIFNKDFVLNVGGAYIRGYEPFWTRGIGELADREGGLEELLTKHPGKLVAPEFGVMPATRAYTATKSDEIMDRNAARHPTVRTPEEAEKGKGIREAEQMKLAGHEADYQKQLKKLQLSPQQAHNIETKMKNVKAYRFKGLPVDVAVEAYQAGTPEEKAIYGPLLRHKINNLSDRDRAKYRQYRDFKKQIEEDEAASHVGAIDKELLRRQFGGPIPPNQPVLVGEQQPELLLPQGQVVGAGGPQIIQSPQPGMIVPQVPRFVSGAAAGVTPGPYELALQKYKILRDIGLQGVYTNQPGKYGGIEAWSPTEQGTPGYMRPEGLPLGQFGVQVFKGGKVRPIDVLADAASHYLVKTDPQMKEYYQQFKDSLIPRQKAKLKDDYEYAKQHDGETRPFEQWAEASRLPAFFRGYTFDQWPKEATSELFTPDQIKLFDKVRDYLGVEKSPAAPTQFKTWKDKRAVQLSGRDPNYEVEGAVPTPGTGPLDKPADWMYVNLGNTKHSDWYPKDMIQQFAVAAKKHGVNPLEYVALGISETGLGNQDPLNPSRINPVVHMDDMKKIYGSEATDTPDNLIDYGARYLAERMKAHPGDKLAGLQSYSGEGKRVYGSGVPLSGRVPGSHEKFFGKEVGTLDLWKEKPQAKRIVAIIQELKKNREFMTYLKSLEAER